MADESADATVETAVSACHCREGWICEAHPEQPWPHGDCPGPGMRCENASCPWWKGPQPAALNTDDWTDVTSARLRPPGAPTH